MTLHKPFLTFVVLASIACTATINADFRGRGLVPASADEIAQCKDTCSSQKSSGCLSDDALATCSNACGGATSDAVAQYRACVSNSACNVGCDGVLGAPDGGAAGTSADASKADAGDAGHDARDANEAQAPDPCSAACDRVATCFSGSALDACHTRCAQSGTQARQNFVSCTSDVVPPNGCDLLCSECISAIGGSC
jgi:hypothetical protein